ncbi:MAG: ferredoxin [Candidatus Eisenbacteria bacterium]
MQIKILHKECCGHGLCRETAPGAFGVDSKNKATILDPESETPEKILEAAENCPCSAIVLMDDEGEITFP